jgi:hypothetical protein
MNGFFRSFYYSPLCRFAILLMTLLGSCGVGAVAK